MGMLLSFIVGLVIGLAIGGSRGRAILIGWLRLPDRWGKPPPPPTPMP